MSIIRMLFLGAMVSAAVGPAWAHRVNVFALVEEDTIRAETYFADGSKCRNSDLLIIDSAGDTLAATRTDAQGQAAIPLQTLGNRAHGDLRVVLAASMGHRAEYLLTAKEVWPGPAAAQAVSVPASAAAEVAAVHVASGTGAAGVAAQVLAGPALRAELAHQLAPLTRAIRDLEEQQRRASVHDVLGGIGYIMGLMGLYFFLRGRSR